MKSVLCTTVFALIFGTIVLAQPYNFDHDVATLRNEYISNYSFQDHAADYIQYSPLALTAALKAFGYESRSSWAELAVTASFSAAIMAGVVNATKYSVGRTRPDGSNSRSFPSGHTATAFTLAAILDREFRDQSPWWGMGGYVLATYVGASRIVSNKHFATDVLSGALIGIGAAHLGYFLSDLVFKADNAQFSWWKCSEDDVDWGKVRSWEIGTFAGQRVVLASTDGSFRGATAGLYAKFPLVPAAGLMLRGAVNTLTGGSAGAIGSSETIDSSGATSSLGVDSSFGTTFSSVATETNVHLGGYYVYNVCKYFYLDAHALLGANIRAAQLGLDTIVGATFALRVGENYRFGLFADYEYLQRTRLSAHVHGLLLGVQGAIAF